MKSEKLSCIFLKKFFLIFQKMELSGTKIKKVLIFSQKKAFLIFWEMEFFKKTSYISGGNLLSSLNKKTTLKRFLIFWETELSGPKLKKLHIFFLKKNFLYFWRELYKIGKQTFFRFLYF